MKKQYLLALAAGLIGLHAITAQEIPSLPTLSTPPQSPLLPGPPAAPVESFCDCAPATGCCPRIWGSVDYLLWWVKDAPSNFALVTTGNPNLPGPVPPGALSPLPPGAIGRPDTQVLFGGSNFNYGAFSGARVTLGGWLDQDGAIGLEVSGFLLEQRAINFGAAGNGSGNPPLYLPGFQVLQNREGSYTIAEPRPTFGVTGNVNYTSTLRFWGTEANGALKLWQGSNGSLVFLGGFKNLNLDESISMSGDLNAFAFDNTDQVGMGFSTRNNFYGGQIGLRGNWNQSKLSVDLTTMIALGVTHQSIGINGYDIQAGPGAVSPGYNPGFWYAAPTMLGTESRNEFSAVPTVQLKVGYNILPNLRATIGYDFIYWTDVVRPGDQINRNINSSQFAPLGNGPPIGPISQRLFNSSDFYSNGLSFGLELKF